MKDEPIKQLSTNEFIQLVGEEPQSDKLHVYISEGLEQIPITTPFRGSDYTLLYVEKGVLKFSINLINHTLKKNESIAINPKSVVQIHEISENLKVYSISFTSQFVFDNFYNKGSVDAFGYFTHNNVPKLRFSKQEGKILKMLIRMLRFYNQQEGTPFREDLIRSTFGVIAYNYARNFKKAYPDLKAELTRQEELVLRFWNILQENVKTDRRVRFYADALNVTTGHLSKTLKETTGKTASQLIEAAVIMEARLLLMDPKLSIAQIAEILRFPDQSFFGKYFKKHLGLSPSAYRKENRK